MASNQLGVERIISLSAVGSLKEEHAPLRFVIPDQFFDRTRGRVSTFFGEGLVAHISFADPICPQLSEVVRQACVQAGVDVVKGGTYLCMEGPAFSTKAESNVYRSWGMDVIGMTNLQEAKLAREAEICYVTVAMVTDYDCWHEEHDAVTVTDILANLAKNAENACKVVAARSRACPRSANASADAALAHALITDPKVVPETTRKKAGAAGWKIPRLIASLSDLLEHCLAGAPWPEHLLDLCSQAAATRALFRIVVEHLADLFEPRLCGVYADLFSEVIARRIPDCMPSIWWRVTSACASRALRSRSGRDPQRLCPFARDAGRRRRHHQRSAGCRQAALPERTNLFRRPAKSWEFFAADPRLRHLPIAYGRGGTLDDRLSVWPELREAVCLPDSIVIDPDSRLTQLGLLPICPEDDYYFFESRSYGGEGDEPLSGLASRWAAETFGVDDAQPYIAPVSRPPNSRPRSASASAKIPPNACRSVRRGAAEALAAPVLIDKGAGGEEAERVERAAARPAGNRDVGWLVRRLRRTHCSAASSMSATIRRADTSPRPAASR